MSDNLEATQRSAEIRFVTINGDVEAILTVTQVAGPGTNGFAIVPSDFEIGPSSAALSATVLTGDDRDWSWTSSTPWLSTDEAVQQSGTQVFSFSADENLSGLARQGELIFTTTDGALSARITVTQFGTEDDDRDGLTNDEETKPYFLVTGQFTWEQARLDALRRGGTLAVITSAGELADMQSVVGDLAGNVWIGGSGEVPPSPESISADDFEWVTIPETPTAPATPSTPLTYENWALEQPDGVFGISAISLEPDYTWSDFNKYTVLSGYVLERAVTNPRDALSGDPSRRVLDGDLWTDRDSDGLLGITEVDPRN